MTPHAAADAVPATASGRRGQATRYALARTAGVTWALAAADVVEAVPLDVPAADLPRFQGSALGAIRHRGRVVPVVDLAHWGAWPAAAGARQVLVLQNEGRLTGVAIECALDIVAVEASRVHVLHHGDQPSVLFRQALDVAACPQPVPVLDSAQQLAQSRVWVQGLPPVGGALPAFADGAPHSARGGISAADGAGPSHVVVEIAGQRFGLAVRAVGSLMRMPAMQELAGLAPALLGVFAWGARKVPVVHIHHALELPAPSREAATQGWLLVVRTDGAALGVAVDRVVGVLRLAADGLAAPEDSLRLGVVSDPGDPCGKAIALLSAAALLQAFPISAIGAQPDRADRPGDVSGRLPGLGQGSGGAGFGETSMRAHLIVQAGRAIAAPLFDLLAIVAWDPSRDVAGSVPPRQLHWRGQWVPLRDMRGPHPSRAAAAASGQRVLIVEEAGRATGLVVDAVIGLVPAYVGTLATMTLNGRRPVTVLTAPVEGQVKSYEVVALGHGMRAAADGPAQGRGGRLATSACSIRAKPGSGTGRPVR